MTIGNVNVFRNGSFSPASVSFEHGVFTAISDANTPCEIDGKGQYLVPGFIDIHIHGAMNADASDADASGLLDISRYLARHGVTTFLPTTMTLDEDTLCRAMTTIRDFHRPQNGAQIGGIHMEGPFLSFEKRGAQAKEHLHPPDFDFFSRLYQASGNQIRIVTVAPEQTGALAFIEKVSRLCTVSLGHTTADYETACAAFSAGASHVTHLFNAMPSLHHRQAGVIGAAFDCNATVEIICDGLHLAPSIVRLAHQIFGERCAIISDSLRCAGMPDGNYELGGQPIVMTQGKATLQNGTLAGSSTNLLEEIRLAVSFGLPLADVIAAVTYAPAKAAGLWDTCGSIDVGKQADFCILDDTLSLKHVYIGGMPAV